MSCDEIYKLDRINQGQGKDWNPIISVECTWVLDVAPPRTVLFPFLKSTFSIEVLSQDPDSYCGTK